MEHVIPGKPRTRHGSRVKRRLFTFLSALPLILWAAVAVMWVRSYYAVDEISWQVSSGRVYRCSSLVGTLLLGVTDGFPYTKTLRSRSATVDAELIAIFPEPSEWSFLGFGVDRSSYNYFPQPGISRPAVSTYLHIPYWSLLTLCLIPPAVKVLTRLRKRRRVAAGLCCTCGYDLRASSDRCPECGTPVSGPATQRGDGS